MSRKAKSLVFSQTGVEARVSDKQIFIKGPLGELAQSLHEAIKIIDNKDNTLEISRSTDSMEAIAMFGTFRALIVNMAIGVTKGFEKKLSLVGVGYRAEATADAINLSLGFSHPVLYKLPKGITAKTPSATEIVIAGIDKQLVGQVAAIIRSYRPPEPYKGKGVRYAGEKILLKETKKK